MIFVPFSRNPPSNLSAPFEPRITFVQEQAPRLVFLVEDTAVMNLQKRWEFVRKALRHLVVYDVPDGTYVSLVVFNSEAKTNARMFRMDSDSDVRQRLGSSLPRNPSMVQESHKCVLCGLQEAIRTLDGGRGGPAGASIILITNREGVATQHDLTQMIQLATENQVQVNVILYPVSEQRGQLSQPSHPLDALVDATRGSSFTVMDEGVGNDSKLSMMVSLINALQSVVHQGARSDYRKPVKIHSRMYPGGITSIAQGTFVIDESLSRDARFSIYYNDLSHVGNTVELVSPRGVAMTDVSMLEEDGDANVIFVNIKSAERGQWSYRVENKADSHQGLHIQVQANEASSRNMALRVWTSSSSNTSSSPSVVYAEVREDDIPVMNARVTATLQRLGNSANGSTYAPIVFSLFDNGVGGVYCHTLKFI